MTSPFNSFGGWSGGGRCWVNFQCQGVLLTWLTVGQGPIVLSVGAGGGCLDIFSSPEHNSMMAAVTKTFLALAAILFIGAKVF